MGQSCTSPKRRGNETYYGPGAAAVSLLKSPKRKRCRTRFHYPRQEGNVLRGAADKGAERGGEAVGGEGGGRDTLPRRRDEGEGGAIEVQQDLRVRLHHQGAAVPDALHLRHRPPHGARLRRPIPQVALVRPHTTLPRSGRQVRTRGQVGHKEDVGGGV